MKNVLSTPALGKDKDNFWQKFTARIMWCSGRTTAATRIVSVTTVPLHILARKKRYCRPTISAISNSYVLTWARVGIAGLRFDVSARTLTRLTPVLWWWVVTNTHVVHCLLASTTSHWTRSYCVQLETGPTSIDCKRGTHFQRDMTKFTKFYFSILLRCSCASIVCVWVLWVVVSAQLIALTTQNILNV